MEKLFLICIFFIGLSLAGILSEILGNYLLKYIEEEEKKKIRQIKQNKKLFDYDKN